MSHFFLEIGFDLHGFSGGTMDTVSIKALSNLREMRLFLAGFERATGVILRISAAHDRSSLHISNPAHCRLAVPLVIGGKHVATFVSNPIAVAAVCDRRKEESTRYTTSDGHRPPLQLTEEQFRGCEQLVSLFARHFSAFANRHLTSVHSDDPPKVRLAKEYIRQHACNSITIDKIAHHVGMSADHLRRIFGKSTGMTLTECIQRVRIVKAEELLADHSRRVIDVAFASGFESVPHFNRVFKSCTGKTPKAFRISLHLNTPGVSRSFLDKKKSDHE